MLDERYEELLNRSIGKLREMLAYEDSEATFKSFLVENGWIDGEDDYEEEIDWEYALDENGQPCVRIKSENEFPAPEEGEYDFEDGADELEDSEAEKLAQSIAGDIAWGKYSLEAIEGLYSKEIIDRINYLI